MRRMILAGLLLSLPVHAQESVELSRSLKAPAYGFELRYPADWRELSADSEILTYYAASPVPAEPGGGPSSRFAVVAPERDGFRANLNVQPRNAYSDINEAMRQEVVRGLEAMGERVRDASFEHLADRIEELPPGRAIVVDFAFTNPEGRRLATRQWTFVGENLYHLSFTDTAEHFQAGLATAGAMIDAFRIFPPSDPITYDEVINLWVTAALLLSAIAGGAAYLLHRRARRVGEYAGGEPTLPAGRSPEGT